MTLFFLVCSPVDSQFMFLCLCIVPVSRVTISHVNISIFAMFCSQNRHQLIHCIFLAGSISCCTIISIAGAFNEISVTFFALLDIVQPLCNGRTSHPFLSDICPKQMSDIPPSSILQQVLKMSVLLQISLQISSQHNDNMVSAPRPESALPSLQEPCRTPGNTRQLRAHAGAITAGGHGAITAITAGGRGASASHSR